MCYILCMSSSVCIASGGKFLRVGGSGGGTPEKHFFYLGKHVTYLGGFSAHGFLPMVFYFG
jgi:hypothetical protein